MSKDWSREEVEIIVAAYFQMLEMEQSRIPYRKSEVSIPRGCGLFTGRR